MGRPKALLPWGRSTLVGELACTLLAAELETIVVIPPTEVGEAIQKALPPRALAVVNPDPRRGPRSSLELGARALLSQGVTQAIVAPVDQPAVSVGLCLSLTAPLKQGAWGAVAAHRGAWGHPYALGDLKAVLSLAESQTARDLLLSGSVTPVEAGPEVLWNLNTPQEYESARRLYAEKERGDG